ncbi:MAG: hypothetical protein ACREFT_19405 [Acetobacteraceae bacterium]
MPVTSQHARGDGRLYHGGAPRLRVGELLLPPAETGHVPPRLRQGLRVNGMAVRDWFGPDLNRPDRVYLTSDRELARGYAAYCGWSFGGHGALYVAEPEGGAEPDADMPWVSVQCPRARIVRVYDPAVWLSRTQTARRLAAHIRVAEPTIIAERQP